MGAIDRLQRSSAGKEAVASAREKERKVDQQLQKRDFERILAHALGKRIPETETKHVRSEEPIIRPGRSPEYTFTRKRVPVDKKKFQERAIQRLKQVFGVTRLDKTPEGTPVIYMDDVEQLKDAHAYKGTIGESIDKEYAEKNPDWKEQEYIAMPSESFGVSPKQRLTEQSVFQHERAHAIKHHTATQNIPWEYRPEELEADKLALNVLKRNLERAGIEYTPAMGAEYLLRAGRDKPFRGEVVPNPSKAPFVDRLDYLPVSTPAKKQMVTDVLGRPSIQPFTDPEEYWEVRKAEALKRFAINPVTYRDVWTGESQLDDFGHVITRGKLAAGVSQEDMVMDSMTEEEGIFK